MVFELDISELYSIALDFYTGHRHSKIERFTSDLPELVETLAQEAHSSGGTCPWGTLRSFLTPLEARVEWEQQLHLQSAG